MKTRVWRTLARGVVLESIRRKDLWVVAILGFLIILAAGALGFYGISGLEVFAKDLAFSVLGLFTTIVAVLTASRVLPEEIHNRTLYPLLARPVSRFDLLAGKLLGAILVTWIAFGILASLTALALASFSVSFEPIMLQYVIAKLMGLALVCTLSLALSVYMTPSAAATMGFILTFGTSMISRGLVLGFAGASELQQFFFKLVNGLLPQVSLFDLGARAANVGWAPVPWWVMGALAAYLVVYGGALLALSWVRFRRQAV